MKKWKKKIKEKKKSKSPGKDNEIQKEMPKVIGSYHDFLVFDKNDKNNNLEFQDCPTDDPNIKDWLILRNSPHKTKSRFSSFFEEMLENDKNTIKENKQNIMNKDENNNIINEDDKNNNNIINEDDDKNNNNIINVNKDDNKNLINNKAKNDNNIIINEEENKDDKDNIINLENEDYNNINNDINNIINNINKINISNENESENENDNYQNINNIINNNKDNDNDNNNVNINDICNSKINNDRNYSEALTKTTTIDSNKLMSERNPSEFSLSSSYNVNFPLMAPGPGSFEQNNILYNNNINLYGKKSIFSNYSGQQQELKKSIYSHYSGNEYQPPIQNSSSGNNSRNDSELNYSTSIKSNFSLFERNSSVEQFQLQPERKVIELNVDMKKVICLEDIRTTIMIKNIPNKFTRDLLLKIIDQNFKGAYDLFILPTDVNRYKNFGYAFINFTCSYYIPYFYGLFNGKKWGSTNSRKICEITYSKIQGRNNLLSHYNNKIIFRNDDVKKYDIDEIFIIPNAYKEIFNKAFPNYNIEEFKYYFKTKMPIKY